MPDGSTGKPISVNRDKVENVIKELDGHAVPAFIQEHLQCYMESGSKGRMWDASAYGGNLRTLLIHGARSVIFKAKDKGTWSEGLLKRRPTNVVITALANKMARTAWAMLAHGRAYQKDYVSVQPA